MRVTGVNTVRANVRRLRALLADEFARAMYQEMSVEMTEMQRRTPVASGNLKRSIHLLEPERVSYARSGVADTIRVTVVAGGPAAPYAVYVHENLEAFHKNGEAKFMESVLLESRPYLAARVAARVKLNRGKL